MVELQGTEAGMMKKNGHRRMRRADLQRQTGELNTSPQASRGKDEAEINPCDAEFLAQMSHELRTPLNVIIGFSELLLDGTLGPVNDQQEQSLQAVLSSGTHLLTLVDGLLNLSGLKQARWSWLLPGKNRVSRGPAIMEADNAGKNTAGGR